MAAAELCCRTPGWDFTSAFPQPVPRNSGKCCPTSADAGMGLDPEPLPREVERPD